MTDRQTEGKQSQASRQADIGRQTDKQKANRHKQADPDRVLEVVSFPSTQRFAPELGTVFSPIHEHEHLQPPLLFRQLHALRRLFLLKVLNRKNSKFQTLALCQTTTNPVFCQYELWVDNMGKYGHFLSRGKQTNRLCQTNCHTLF